VYAYYQAV